jgi:hypothetical protein
VKAETATLPSGGSGSPTALSIFWLEILELAHNGDDGRVADTLATLQMRREHLDELYGASTATRLWNDYIRAFTSFAGDGASEIARKIRERRYDDVEVVPLTGIDIETLPPAERKSAAPLRTNLPVYTVRLKRSEEPDGIRIDTFVFLDGCWRTALKIAAG